jgi:hypothetical protein
MKKILFLLLLPAFLPAARGQFFGGYADGVTSVPTGRNTIGPASRMVYDDFTFFLPGDIDSFSLLGRDNTGSPVAIAYEIRTGVSPGNGGTLLFSGFSTGATTVPRPTDGSFGTPPPGSGQYVEYIGGFPGGTVLHLNAGTYWIGLAPLEGFGSFDVATTQGAGGIGGPLNNGNAFYYDSSNPSANFVPMNDYDFAMRIFTTSSTIPEPGSLSLFGLMSFVWFRRQKHSRAIVRG